MKHYTFLSDDKGTNVNEGYLDVSSVANLLEEALGTVGNSSKKQKVVAVESSSQTPSMLNGLSMEDMQYIQDSVLNMIDTSVHIEGLMDVDKILLELAMLEELE